jgi:peptide deformylase
VTVVLLRSETYIERAVLSSQTQKGFMMSVLPVYLYGTKVLRKKAHPVQDLDHETVKLIYDMFETMHKANGIGLAATQVGSLKRVIVIDISDVEEGETDGAEGTKNVEPSEGKPKKLVLINPRVISEAGSWSVEEGCLSLPDLRGEVTRPDEITIEFQDGNFEHQQLSTKGLLGRVILHEIDHLDGVLFIDRLSKAKQVLVRPELNEIKNGKVETSYPVVTASEE